MELVIYIIMVLFVSCSPNTDSDDLEAGESNKDGNAALDQIPADGIYRYDVAFTEWDGKSMG